MFNELLQQNKQMSRDAPNRQMCLLKTLEAELLEKLGVPEIQEVRVLRMSHRIPRLGGLERLRVKFQLLLTNTAGDISEIH